MTSDPDERLRAVLRADPPAGVAALGTDSRAALADLLEDTRRRQARSLEEAFVSSLKHVPFPLRGLVRKVLMG